METIKMKDIYKALLEIQKLNIVMKKDTKGMHGAKYVTLDAIIEEYSPKLSEQGLIVTHNMENVEGKPFLTTQVIHADSEGYISTTFPLSSNSNMQQMGSQITYAKRYNICQLLNIAAGEDDDADSTVKKQGTKKAPAPAPAPIKKANMTNENLLKLMMQKDTYKTAGEAITVAKNHYTVSKEMEQAILSEYAKDINEKIATK